MSFAVYFCVCVFNTLAALTSSLLDEVLLHVVAVNLGATEDDGLVHLVLLDGPNRVLALQDLDGLRPHFYTHACCFNVCVMHIETCEAEDKDLT